MLKLGKELDVVKVIKRLRQHNEALKSSILCDKRRRRLIKHTKACIVDIETDSEPAELSEAELKDSLEVKHGYCRSNEQLISENIFRRILEHHPGCMCHAIKKTKPKASLPNDNECNFEESEDQNGLEMSA